MATGREINKDIHSDEVFDALCSMCKNRGKTTEGEKFCVDCHDYFCINCVQVHSQVPVCVSHKVLDISQVKPGTNKDLPRAPTERCDRHLHKYIDMYCHNHDDVGCSICMTIDHRSCKDIFYIPEFIQNKSYQVAPREIQTKLKALAKTLTVQADKLKQDKHRLLKRKEELLNDIRKLRQEINDQLDTLEKSSIDEIEYKSKHFEGKIEEGLKQLQALKAKVTSAYDKMESSSPNQAELFVYLTMGTNAENIAKKCTEDITMKITADCIELQPDRTLLQQLKQNNTIGTLKQKSTKTAGTLFHVTGGRPYCVQVKSDENKCHISSSCYMEDGTVILADNDNNNLKRLDSSSYRVTDYCELSGEPYQICKINATEVAVTLPSRNEVNLISVDREMKTKNKIKTDFDCYGLAYANNHLYVSDEFTSVYTYTMSGRKLKQFCTDQSGHKLFSNINSLAVRKDARRIYVADYNKGLIVLDGNGEIVTTFNGEELQVATCCHLIETGRVLVSGYKSNNILQFTSDGKLIGEVMKAVKENEGILSICCNAKLSKMCISRYNEDNIAMYDI
ncbi:uncharacterized protein LOC132716533 [Ruditapes philippinarum]|uniref:uncharacterized protein LOC132716533 n=1 Tax=Ruditapes philippinarum TaxID=129788 RepID=UPI00295B474C|nr:uncharacterized protein LOC132716533 [Ruditapes philippinarum]